MEVEVTAIIERIFRSEIKGSFEKRVFWLRELNKEKYASIWQLEMQGNSGDILDEFKARSDSYMPNSN